MDINDPNTADGLKDLLRDSLPGDANCDAYGKHGVYACLKVGTMPDTGWMPRKVSLVGATSFVSKSAGGRSGVELLGETMNYVYAKDGNAYWTGLIGGSGNLTVDYAVAEWNGSGLPKLCYFEQPQKHLKFNRAMNGTSKNSMVNLIGDKFYPLTWNLSDVAVYCDANDEPVIVVPMIKQIWAPGTSRTAIVPGGTLFIRGSSTGDPAFDFREEVRAGEVPVPVYPLSVEQQQRDTILWAAGRRIKDKSAFGFEPADADSQTGNASEYLLQDSNGGTDWLTPMTPRGLNQLFNAYAAADADHVKAGVLNTLRIYVLAKNDPRVVNLDVFEKPIREAISQANAGFFSSGGTLNEYLPTKGGYWQVYAELNGQPVYRITAHVEATTAKVVVQIDKVDANQEVSAGNPGNMGTTNTASCKPQMDHAEQLLCLSGIAGQLNQNDKPVSVVTSTPVPTPSVTPAR